MKVLTVAQMQKAERDCAAQGISTHQLMENAGLSFAESVKTVLDEVKDRNILVVIGPGNNGGDGLVAARHFYDWGAGVTVYLCKPRPADDVNLKRVKSRGILCNISENDPQLGKLQEYLSKSSCIIDAVFGTGQSRPITGVFSQILNSIKQHKKQHPEALLFSMDLPSGVNADTGAADPATPQADYTITLGFPKVGLFNLPAAELAGEIDVVDIGIPSELVENIKVSLMEPKQIRKALPARPGVSHKGNYGKVLALVGSINYTGAAYLACSGCMRSGAGLTTLAISSTLLPIVASKLNEITYLPLPPGESEDFSKISLNMIAQSLPDYDVFLVGCGIGLQPAVQYLLKGLLGQSGFKLPRTIIDADGLNIMSRMSGWYEQFLSEAIVTPHAGEMSRLTGKSIDQIQTNRVQTTLEAAVAWHKIVVLKGAYTIIADPEGRVEISPFANPGLATAGTGDVLAGTIAGLAAQGLESFSAATCGVYVHALAGELVKADLGDTGMLAGDLLPALPRAIRQLKLS